jgi:hypothetical protein
VLFVVHFRDFSRRRSWLMSDSKECVIGWPLAGGTPQR